MNSFYNLKKRKCILILSFLIMILPIFYCMTFAHASDPPSGIDYYISPGILNGDKNESGDTLYPGAIDTGNERMAFDNFRKIVTGSVEKECLSILDGTMFNRAGLKTIMENLYGVLKNIGIALLVVFFLMELMDKMTRDNLDAEALIRMLIKYIIAKSLIADNGIKILMALFNIANGITGGLAGIDNSAESSKFLSQVARLLQDSSDISCLIFFIVTIIPLILEQLLFIIIKATCYGRLIEIVLRGGFAPIGCAGMVQDGFTGNGARYLKKFFGCCLQGSIIMAILIVGSKLQTFAINSAFMGGGESITDALWNILAMLLIPLVEVMTILKSQPLANDVANA